VVHPSRDGGLLVHVLSVVHSALQIIGAGRYPESSDGVKHAAVKGSQQWVFQKSLLKIEVFHAKCASVGL
jgi:hypothetical protein